MATTYMHGSGFMSQDITHSKGYCSCYL